MLPVMRWHEGDDDGAHGGGDEGDPRPKKLLVVDQSAIDRVRMDDDYYWAFLREVCAGGPFALRFNLGDDDREQHPWKDDGIRRWCRALSWRQDFDHLISHAADEYACVGDRDGEVSWIGSRGLAAMAQYPLGDTLPVITQAGELNMIRFDEYKTAAFLPRTSPIRVWSRAELDQATKACAAFALDPSGTEVLDPLALFSIAVTAEGGPVCIAGMQDPQTKRVEAIELWTFAGRHETLMASIRAAGARGDISKAQAAVFRAIYEDDVVNPRPMPKGVRGQIDVAGRPFDMAGRPVEPPPETCEDITLKIRKSEEST